MSSMFLNMRCRLAKLRNSGAGRDDISTEKGLLKSWPSGGPEKAWMTTDEAGIGYAKAFQSLMQPCTQWER